MKLTDARAARRAALAVCLALGPCLTTAAGAAPLRQAFIDCDGDHTFDPAIDKPLAAVDLRKGPAYGVPSPPTDCAPARTAAGAPARPGFVLPRGASLAARKLQIVVDGDVTIDGKLAVHSTAGGRPAAVGNAFGALVIRAGDGSVRIGDAATVKADMFSIIAAGDVEVGREARLVQSTSGFALPRIRDAADYRSRSGACATSNDPSCFAPLELGPQEIRSADGSVRLLELAAVEGNDRLEVTAGVGVDLSQDSRLHARNGLLVRGADHVASHAGRLRSAAIALEAVTVDAGSGIKTPSGHVSVGLQLLEGTRPEEQCALGETTVPQCVPAAPTGSILDLDLDLAGFPLAYAPR